MEPGLVINGARTGLYTVLYITDGKSAVHHGVLFVDVCAWPAGDHAVGIHVSEDPEYAIIP